MKFSRVALFCIALVTVGYANAQCPAELNAQETIDCIVREGVSEPYPDDADLSAQDQPNEQVASTPKKD